MLSDYDYHVLIEHGFTNAEINILDSAVDPAGNPQHINLSDPAWQDALQDHLRIKEAFEEQNEDSTYQDYENFINDWFRSEVGSFDPWIWIDQNYYKMRRDVSRARWEEAYTRVRNIQDRLGI